MANEGLGHCSNGKPPPEEMSFGGLEKKQVDLDIGLPPFANASPGQNKHVYPVRSDAFPLNKQ